jgi:F-type H+-transporting ATPase subunit b
MESQMIGRISKLACGISMFAALALTSIAAAQEHAAHEPLSAMPGPKEGLVTGVTAIVVFLLVLAVLSLKVWPTISKALNDRASKIRDSIEEAEQAQLQARQALEQYEKNLASARAEAQKMLDDAKVQQQAISAELKARSDVELGQLREKAKRDIDSAKAAAIAEIHAHATALATTMAGKILKREINAGDQARMIQESLQEMGAGRN